MSFIIGIFFLILICFALLLALASTGRKLGALGRWSGCLGAGGKPDTMQSRETEKLGPW